MQGFPTSPPRNSDLLLYLGFLMPNGASGQGHPADQGCQHYHPRRKTPQDPAERTWAIYQLPMHDTQIWHYKLNYNQDLNPVPHGCSVISIIHKHPCILEICSEIGHVAYQYTSWGFSCLEMFLQDPVSYVLLSRVPISEAGWGTPEGARTIQGRDGRKY